jgi:N-acetylmuramoyl-L-alanine amidase
LVLIYLDPGHGGKDGGAAANGIKEKDIVLTLCKKMKSLLAAYDCKVLLTRETDVYLSLDERTKKANASNADVLVSVHVNSAGATSARGFETYTYPNANAGTKALQNGMHLEIIRAMGAGIEDRGKKTANFHMVRESKMKAVLTENLFISNPKDAALLKQDTFLNKLALGHVNGLQKFLGLKKIERPPQDKLEPVTGGKLYRVQVGAFEDKENADALAADLTKQGYRPYVKYE